MHDQLISYNFESCMCRHVEHGRPKQTGFKFHFTGILWTLNSMEGEAKQGYGSKHAWMASVMSSWVGSDPSQYACPAIAYFPRPWPWYLHCISTNINFPHILKVPKSHQHHHHPHYVSCWFTLMIICFYTSQLKVVPISL